MSNAKRLSLEATAFWKIAMDLRHPPKAKRNRIPLPELVDELEILHMYSTSATVRARCADAIAGSQIQAVA
jgi:hypothetical protein